MSISPYFHELRSAYQSEMDDLRFDSEGRDVLSQRLAGKRQEIGFLLQMMELSPEMVAVVFHQGFSFTGRMAMDHLLTHDADAFPAWSTLAASCELAPWAQDLASMVLKAPGGDRFMTLTAGLEYMAGLPVAASALAAADEHDDDEDDDEDGAFDQDDGDDQSDSADDGEGGRGSNARARHEAGADWLVQQGFDTKD